MERMQVEEVFRLGGGELEDKSWGYLAQSTYHDGSLFEPTGRTSEAHLIHGAFRYHYDGVPDYVAGELEAAHPSRDLRTVVYCALFGMPTTFYDAKDGSRWERVAFYGSSGETECPTHGETADEDCQLCEAPKGEKHSMIYLGDGWGEAVYMRATPRIEFELIDHGCDGAQYFPGCGVAFTTYTNVTTGCGDSAREAAEDALEQFYSGEDTDRIVNVDELEAAVRELSNEPDTFTDQDRKDAEESGEELNPEWHHYVSIRWRIVND
jgi:hypothetical protein